MKHPLHRRFGVFGWERRRLERLVADARLIIEKMFAVCPDAYVALSGGKDSAVLTRLVLDVKPDVLVVHSYHPDNETPEAERMVDELQTLWGFRLIRGEAPSIIEMYAELGMPQTVEANSYFDLQYIKRLRATHRQYGGGLFMGLRAQESRGRRMNRWTRGNLYQLKDGEWHCNPLGDWKVENIWAFIGMHRIPYATLYDDPRAGGWRWSRLGDWSGVAGAEHGRLVRLKATRPELWNRLVKLVPEVAKWG